MDGVLIDAKEWHYEALNLALALFGHTITLEEHHTRFDGLATRTKLCMLSRDRGLPVGLHDFINEMKQCYTMDMVREKCMPTFQHQYALSGLKRQGYKVAVASNSVRASVVGMMELANLTGYLDLMLSNQDVSAPKPSPEIYQTAIRHFGLTPQECLVVEDNENGIRAAKAAGAHLLAVDDVSCVHLDAILNRIRAIEHEMELQLPLLEVSSETAMRNVA
jgi:beta-phosphoglucomutase